MLSKFSVKKPMTVFVAVILVIILGVVSFTGMTTDLLPSMELPYVVVFTTYPGASPEKVETSVTKPLEQALSTTSGLEEITSISQENVSMVILQLVQGTNMDSAMLEMSGYIDIAEASFEDSVGAPTLMKINPDMMPVMVASVDADGMDRVAVSELVNNLMPGLERIDGVASISTTGILEEELGITLNQKKINALNDKILSAVDEKFADAKQEIDDAKQQLENGKKQLDSQSSVQGGKIAEATVQLAQAKYQLQSGLSALSSGKSELQNKIEELSLQKQQLTQLKQAMEALPQVTAGIAEIETGIAAINTQIQPLEVLLLDYETRYAQAQADGDAELIAELTQKIAQTKGQITALESARSEMMGKKGELETQKSQIEAVVAAAGDITLSEASENLSLLEQGIAQCQMSLVNLQAQETELDTALTELTKKEKELEAGKITASEALAEARIKIALGESSLEQASQEFESSRDAALKSAGVKEVLTSEMVANILAAQNFSMPAGYLQQAGEQQTVKVGEQFESVEQLEELLLFDTGIEEVGKIYLKDVADIAFTDNAGESYAKINGNDGIILMFSKQSAASTAEVSKKINEAFAQLMEENPGLHITPLQDQGVYIGIVIDSVLQNLLFGGLLAILILLLFLRDIKPTIIIALSIPISLMFAVVLMYFSGVTLNVISLSGLALGVGMLVDNSIVVIENIYRLRSLGVPVGRAAVEGAKQVAGAIFASTLTTVCVFLPIVFTQGISREIFTDMGLTIAYSLLASLIVALTLVPAMSSGMLGRVKERKHGIFDRIVRIYQKALAFALRRKALVITVALALLIASAAMVPSMGMSLMPQADSMQMSITMQMPQGSSKEETYEMSGKVMDRILTIGDVETVGAMESGGLMGGITGGAGGNSISMYAMLKDDKKLSNQEVRKLILEKTQDLECELTVAASGMDISMLTGSGIEVVIKGEDLDELENISKDIMAMMQQTEGTTDISNGLEDSKPEVRINVDKNKAMEYGLTTAQIYQKVALALKTESQATTITISGKDYPVIVIKDGENHLTEDTLKEYAFEATVNGEEKTVTLGEIATFTEAQSPTAINRDGQTRYLTVTAAVDDEHNISLVSREFEKLLSQYEAPAGYTVDIEGENQAINDAMRDMVFMVLLAIVMIYMIMVAQFQSLLSPFIIMFTIPLAFTGGLIALLIAGMELSIVAMLGFLMLAGIIVNNGIVFVDYTNQLRMEGMERREALLEAGRTRLRPILMTALTTILGLSTLSLGMGTGADMMQPLAVVTIGGLIYATLLTLFVVPALYDIMARKPIKVRLEEEKSEKEEIALTQK